MVWRESTAPGAPIGREKLSLELDEDPGFSIMLTQSLQSHKYYGIFRANHHMLLNHSNLEIQTENERRIHHAGLISDEDWTNLWESVFSLRQANFIDIFTWWQGESSSLTYDFVHFLCSKEIAAKWTTFGQTGFDKIIQGRSLVYVFSPRFVKSAQL